MSTTKKHSPLPWKTHNLSIWSDSPEIDKKDRTNMVATASDRWRMPDSEKVENLKHIVLCVSSHDELMSTLKQVVEDVECYCCDVGVAVKSPCVHCVAESVLKKWSKNE